MPKVNVCIDKTSPLRGRRTFPWQKLYVSCGKRRGLGWTAELVVPFRADLARSWCCVLGEYQLNPQSAYHIPRAYK